VTERPSFVLHFSEDPAIERFVPHVPRSRPELEPLVWAIDEDHAPLYWFPRACPRVTYWAGPETALATVERFLAHTTARRVHAIESAWLHRVGACELYAYRFDGAAFERREEADGHRVARAPVAPLGVEPVGDLLGRHAAAGIELRATPSLWPLHDAVAASDLRFSIVRMANAAPR
jgi:uncharacterized protein DUF6886